MPPLIFVLGDSISIHYGPYLERMLEGCWCYDRKRGTAEALADLDTPAGANGGDSGDVLAYLECPPDGIRPDLLLLNCGLHDLRTDRATGRRQVELPLYRANLERIVPAARRFARDVLWVDITPVDPALHQRRKGFDRSPADVDAYNAAAAEVMGEAGVLVVPLHDFTSRLDGALFTDGVHFLPEVSRLQAAFLAGWLADSARVADSTRSAATGSSKGG